MKVLALSSYPVEAAATRHRIAQFVDPLRAAGIEVELSPFFDSAAFKRFYSARGFLGLVDIVPGLVRRMRDVVMAGRYDAVFVQREAMFFGPAVFEWLLSELRGLPLVLDLDDATYIAYESPTYGKLGSALKFFGKTDRLIRKAQVVVCGNRFIAEHVEALGSEAVVAPTTVNPDVFRPKERQNPRPVLGWIGTHSTFPLLESVFPTLTELSQKHDFVLRVVGSGRRSIEVSGVDVENVEWSLASEPDDFSSLDVGLYPITTSSSASEEWLRGKSGFKAIQYLAAGVPFVMTPVGVCAEIGESGRTHLNASTPDEWAAALSKLISDEGLRDRLGKAGRAEFLKSFDPSENVKLLSKLFNEIV